jgi:hypothetical protein
MNENAAPTEPEVQSESQKASATGLKMLWWLVAIVLGVVGGYIGWSTRQELVTAILGAMLGLLFGFLIANGSKRGCGT